MKNLNSTESHQVVQAREALAEKLDTVRRLRDLMYEMGSLLPENPQQYDLARIESKALEVERMASFVKQAAREACYAQQELCRHEAA